MTRVQSYSIKEFMAGKHRESSFDRLIEKIKTEKIVNHPLAQAAVYTSAITFVSQSIPKHAFAAVPPALDTTVNMGDATRETILKAFDPLIDLIQALSYPIAGVMIAGGCLFIMIGSRDKGMDMLRNASMGYILVQLSPLLLKLLVGIGAQVA
jgi:hypothetical protein